MGDVSTRSARRRAISMGVVGVMVAALLPFAGAAPALANGIDAVAYDMVGSASSNLTSYTNAWELGFPSSAYDKFEKLDRDVDGDIPYALLDDSLVSYPGDTAGIVDDNNHDEFFGVSDTENNDNSGPVVATWVFDTSGAGSNLELSIDMGAMGDFEADDSFTFTYQFDGGSEFTAFESSVDEAGSLTYTLASGTETTLDDPMQVDGENLTNVLTTRTAALTGGGDELTLTLTATTNGGDEAFAFQNIIVSDATPPFVSAYDMVGSASQNLTSYTNAWELGFPSSAYDKFEKLDRDVDGDIPYALLDDSLVSYPGDTAGIVDDNNHDEFFGVSDTENSDNSGPVQAQWVFDITGGTNLALSIDMGAMGDFETSDEFVFSYEIDGGGAQVAFQSSVDEAGSLTYTLASGTETTLDDPLSMNGTIVTNVLTTFKTNIDGTGSALTLTFTAATDGGEEGFAFQNVLIDETATVEEPPTVYLSEIHYDNDGTDANEFVEVTGDAGTDLTGWSVLLYNGSGGAVYDTIALSGTIDDESGGMGALSFLRSGIQNGAPDGFALVNDSNELIEFLSYEGTFEATDGAASGVTSTDLGVAEGSSTQPDESLQLYDGTWVGPGLASPGDLNTELAVEITCGDPATAIHDVQGDGDASPLVGDVVEIEGIVVGDFQAFDGGPDDEPLDGFMLQEEDADADADAATSEGVFVYAPGGTDVSVGDLVRVQGTVSEYYDLTEVGSVDAIAVCSSGNALPTAAAPVLPTDPADEEVDWESMEGMRVAIAQTLHVTETYRLGSFGEVVLSAIGPQDQPNQVAAADSAAADEVRALNTASRIVLDDGEEENESYPNETWNPATTPYLQNGGTLRSGDAITGLAGVLHYAFDQYEIQPVNVADPLHPADAITFTGFTTRPALPDVGSGFTVASFNVLNYFTTLGSRGAETADEFERQADKIVSAIVELDADVVGLIEIENNGTAIADLVGRLNAAAGATRVYDYIDTGVIGSDEIAVGFIYDTLTTTPDGAFALLDSTVSPAFLDEKNRPALAQTFQETATGGSVTVAINHLKSKGSDCDDTANPGDPAYGVAPYAEDPDTGGYAGNCNLTRTAAAQVLGQWMDDDPTGTGADAALILGDLNSYANEDPITALEGLGWTDLIEAYVGNSFAEGGYSYVYDGEHGTLDYGLANDEASGAVTGAAAWHINSVEPPALDYNDYNPAANYSDDEFRSSDHDPVLVGLDLRTTPADLKRDAQADLTDILGLGGVVDDRRITRAIADIEASLAPELWTSERTLDKDTGKRVFAAERRAVRRLLWTSPAIDAEVTAVIEKLLEADRLLATIALEESNASAWDQSRAEKWIRCGDKAAAEGDYFRAVALYMKAWIKATNEVF